MCVQSVEFPFSFINKKKRKKREFYSIKEILFKSVQ